jgi:hypothetical protein
VTPDDSSCDFSTESKAQSFFENSVFFNLVVKDIN